MRRIAKIVTRLKKGGVNVYLYEQAGNGRSFVGAKLVGKRGSKAGDILRTEEARAAMPERILPK